MTNELVNSGGVAKAVVRGARWMGLMRLAVQLAQFGIGLLLARLLAPEDFGLVASVSVATGFAFIIFEGGLRSALVHIDDIGDEDFDAAFWLNVAAGMVVAALFTALGPFIADFFGDRRLAGLSSIIALTFTFSLGVAHAAQLQRRLRFRRLAVAEASGTLVGLLATVVLAAAGGGVHSLAWGPVCGQIAASIFLFLAFPWRPRFRLPWAAVRKLLRFSVPLLGANATEYAARNIDNLLIGRYAGAASLGLYNRAYNLMLLPLTQLTTAVGNAVSPVLATMREDLERASRAYIRAASAISVLAVPVLAGLAASAEGMVPLLWGDQWTEAVPLVRILCLAGLPLCFTATTTWLYQAQGRTRAMLGTNVLWTALGIALIVGGLQWGAIGVASAVLVRTWTGLPYELWMATRTLPLSFVRLLWTQVAPTLVLALGMALAVWLLPMLLPLSRDQAATVLIQAAAGAGMWVILAVTFLRSGVADVWQMLRGGARA